MITVSWATIGVIIILYIIGWLISYFKYSRNEARHLGNIEGTVKGIDTRMESLEKRMENFERRLDSFISNWPGDASD